MITIKEYYEQAKLSSAAYAGSLNKNMTKDELITALLESGKFTEEMAEDFANTYKVIDQYTDPYSGFSGTVFENTSNKTGSSGKIYMAMRGTQPTSGSDWSTNIADIGSDGVAIDQAIAMYNWYQRLKSPVGSVVTQYQYHKETPEGNPGTDHVF